MEMGDLIVSLIPLAVFLAIINNLIPLPTILLPINVGVLLPVQPITGAVGLLIIQAMLLTFLTEKIPIFDETLGRTIHAILSGLAMLIATPDLVKITAMAITGLVVFLIREKME